MQITDCKITEIFFIIDEFSKVFNDFVNKNNICRVQQQMQFYSAKLVKMFSKAKQKKGGGGGYRFKLHLIINDAGEIINFMITPDNVDDRAPLKHLRFVEKVHSKLFGDRGYISKELFANLFIGGIQLITK